MRIFWLLLYYPTIYYCNTLQLESVRELLFSTQFGYNMINFIAREGLSHNIFLVNQDSIHDFESEKKQEFRLEKKFSSMVV